MIYLIFLLSSCILGSYGAGHSDYYDESTWPAKCSTGIKQSPVDILVKDIIFDRTSTLKKYNYNRRYRASVKNDGHTVTLKVDAGHKGMPFITGNFLNNSVYLMDNLHFHWDSEHSINGNKFPLEGHFVHFKESAGNFTEAKKQENGLVVLSVLYEVTKQPTKKFVDISGVIKNISCQINQDVSLKNSISLRTLLPRNTENFYRYEGSLTSPGCEEVITWIIFSETTTIGSKQLAALKTIVTENKELVSANNRRVQKLNGRKISFNGDVRWLQKRKDVFPNNKKSTKVLNKSKQ